MLKLQILQKETDIVGAAASGLCLLHCLATPFLFIAQAGSVVHHAESPSWWNLIDVLMLIVSLFAVYWAVKNTSKQWIKYALSASWIFLALIILNEKFEGFHLVEELIYIPTLSLVLFHLYNRKYCNCKDEECNTPPNKT